MVLGMEELEVVKGNNILIYLYANISTIWHQVTGAMWQLELSECLLCGQEGQERAHKCKNSHQLLPSPIQVLGWPRWKQRLERHLLLDPPLLLGPCNPARLACLMTRQGGLPHLPS